MSSFQWNGGSSGSWDVAANWNPTGVPGPNDSVTIGTFSGSTQTVTGPGAAATVQEFGTTTLAGGDFTVSGDLSGSGGFGGGGLLILDGANLRVDGTLRPPRSPGLMSVKNGATVQVGNLSSPLGTGVESGGINVDATSSMEVGTAGNAAIGSLTIDTGQTVTGSWGFKVPTFVNDGTVVTKSFSVSANNIINNGTITLSNLIGVLQTTNGVSGAGTINLGQFADLEAGYFGPQTGNTIRMINNSDTLTVLTTSLDASSTFNPTIYGFNATDFILFGAPATSVSVSSPSANLSVVSLLNGTQVVGRFDLAGSYTDLTFRATPMSFTPFTTGTIVNGTQVTIGSSGTAVFGQTWNTVGIRDYNGDGVADLAWQRPSDNLVEIQFVTRSSTLGGGLIRNSPFDASWSVAATGDFNGDASGDLVYRRSGDGLTEIQFLNGLNSAGGGTIANNPFDASWNVVGTGDFNGDGKSDLVWQRPSDGLVEVQLLNGTTGIGGGLILNSPFGPDWKPEAVGDFNGDGKSDLLWERPSDGLVEVQFLNGSSAVGGGVIANNPFGSDWSVVGTGDFNGDGKSDLVWQRASDDLVQIQYLNGNTAVGGGVIPNSPFGPGWQVVGVGDFNADGSPDLVYHNAGLGITEIQLLSGTLPIGGGIVSM